MLGLTDMNASNKDLLYTRKAVRWISEKVGLIS